MAALQCEICGGKLTAKSGGIFECDSCGMQYDKTRIQEMVQEIKGTVKVEGTVQVTGTVKVDSTTANQKLTQRMYIALRDREYETGAQLAEQILETDPENPDAYLGKLMAKKKISVKENLSNLRWTFDNEPEYKNAKQYGSEDMKRLLTEANQAIVNRQKKAGADVSLSSGDRNFEKALYEKAIADYQNAAPHHDVAEKINKCNQMIYARDHFYGMCSKACEGSAQKVQEAQTFFREYKEYAPCAKAEQVCKKILKMAGETPKTDASQRDRLVKEINSLNEKKNQSTAALGQLGFFAKKEKKTALRNEIAAIDSELQSRSAQLEAIDGAVRNYQAKRQDLNGELMLIHDVLQLRNAKAGQAVTFGRYYYRNGRQLEPLTWTVFKKNEYLYLLADNVIDAVPFGTAYSETLKWKNSELYNWLNGTFYQTAFKDYERKYIVEVTEPAKDDLEWRKKYPAKATDYAISRRVTTRNGYACWFLQSNCYRNYCPDKVTEDGTALGGYSMEGVLIHNLREGVRPMIILNLEKIL